ncbi:hypothetical protein D9Q98_009238 [Chlorella vulgaris]|uniref:Uncharacterized protein n=1 Tax=Chlorella vulgaris TaxID=3077 RepID=A0A9D4YX25_CHLVU|nr:hypothetical protein D9Q98_009238 [Chlorella vulgaris]
MRANTAVLASFYATCTSPAAYSTAAAALVASSPPSPGAGRAQKEGNPTPFQNYEQADGVELKARQGARDAGSVLVRNKSSASTGSGGSQPWSPAFAAAELCFTSSSRWLHAQPSTINLRPAARRLIFESAQLPAATDALLAIDPCLNSNIRNMIGGMVERVHQQRCKASTLDTLPSTINLRPAARRLIFESAQLPAATDALLTTDPCYIRNSSIRNIVDGIELRVQQQRYNKDSAADTPPSTINLRPAARRLIFESAQLPAATEALLATDPCVNSSIRNIVDGIELRLQQQRYNKDSAADTPPSTVSLRLAARRLIFESAQLPAAAEALLAIDPCLNSNIRNMIGGMVERVHQQRCKASTLDTLPSTINLRPAARRLIFESAQLPAATDALLTTDPCYIRNSSIRNIVDGIELRVQQQRYNKDSAADTPPSTINLRPAARRLIFESAQLPAATEALLATDPCVNSSIRNIVDGIELRLQQQRYNKDSAADTPPSTVSLRLAARRLIFEFAQLPAAAEAPPAADPCLGSSIKNMIGGMVERVHQLRCKASTLDTLPSTVSLRLAARRLIFESAQLPAAAEALLAIDPCLNSNIRNMIGGMVERVHQQRCKASTLDTLPSTVSLLPAARRLIFESAQLPAAAEAVLQKTTAHEPQPLCLCRDWSLAPVASSAVVKGSAWQPATRVEGFSIGAGDAQPQHIPASVAAVTAQQQPVKAFDMWSAPLLGGNISSRAISGSDAQWQLSTALTSCAAVTAQQHPVKVFDMWSAPWLGSNIKSRAISGSDAQWQPSTAPTSSAAVTAQQHPVKVFDMWSGPSFAISNAEHQPIAAPICSGDGTAQQQPLGAFNMWSSVWIGGSIVQVCA